MVWYGGGARPPQVRGAARNRRRVRSCYHPASGTALPGTCPATSPVCLARCPRQRQSARQGAPGLPRFPSLRGDDGSPVSRLTWGYAGAPKRNPRWLGDHYLRTARPAVRAAFEDVELTVANDTTVLHRSGGDQAALYRDPSAGPGPGPRSRRGAPLTAPIPGDPAVLSLPELLRRMEHFP